MMREGEQGQLTARTSAEVRGQDVRPQGQPSGWPQEQEGQAEQGREEEDDEGGEKEAGKVWEAPPPTTVRGQEAEGGQRQHAKEQGVQRAGQNGLLQVRLHGFRRIEQG